MVMTNINAYQMITYRAVDKNGYIVAEGRSRSEVMSAAVGTDCQYFEIVTRLIGSDI